MYKVENQKNEMFVFKIYKKYLFFTYISTFFLSRYALKMIQFREDSKNNAEKEFDLLKLLDHVCLIKLIGDDFYINNDIYCFLTEFYEVE